MDPIIANTHITFTESGRTYYVTSVDADCVHTCDVWADEQVWHAQGLVNHVRWANAHEIDSFEREFDRTCAILAYDSVL